MICLLAFTTGILVTLPFRGPIKRFAAKCDVAVFRYYLRKARKAAREQGNG